MDEFKLSNILKHKQFNFHIEVGCVNGTFPMHTNNFCEIFFVVSGSGIHKAGDTEYTLQKGELFAVKGCENHGFTQCHDLKLYNIMFKISSLEIADCKTLPGFWVLFLHEQSLGNISHLLLMDSEFTLVKSWCETMLGEYTTSQSGFQTICRGLLMQLTVFLSRKCQNLNQMQPDFRLAKALVHMEANFAEELNVSKLAKLVGLSPRHFSRIFNQIYGTSPINHLLTVRIERAKEFLLSGEYTITEISSLCGFQDTNYFSKVFKQKTTQSPTHFKK